MTTKAELRTEFWNAGNEELLTRPIVAAGIGLSVGWLELKAVTGDGIPFIKFGRRCLYRKSDVLAWVNANSQKTIRSRDLKVSNSTPL